MRFLRVDENLLPKAHSATSKHAEEDPDTVDLRRIVTRMRAITSGPDISTFQQSYTSAMTDSYEPEDDFADEEADPFRAASPASEAPLEPYHPDLLPQSRPQRPEPPPQSPVVPAPPPLSPQTSIDARLEALRREMRRDEQPRPAFGEQTSQPRREGGMSLRESILKKPLGSLYNKD